MPVARNLLCRAVKRANRCLPPPRRKSRQNLVVTLSRQSKNLELDAFKKLPGSSTVQHRPPAACPILTGKKSSPQLHRLDPVKTSSKSPKIQTALGAQNIPAHQSQANPLRRQLAFRTPQRTCKGDASITNTPGLLLASTATAFHPSVDPKKRAAPPSRGWRGTLRPSKNRPRTRRQFNQNPSISSPHRPLHRPCCYELRRLRHPITSHLPMPPIFSTNPVGEEPNPLSGSTDAPATSLHQKTFASIWASHRSNSSPPASLKKYLLLRPLHACHPSLF